MTLYNQVKKALFPYKSVNPFPVFPKDDILFFETQKIRMPQKGFYPLRSRLRRTGKRAKKTAVKC